MRGEANGGQQQEEEVERPRAEDREDEEDREGEEEQQQQQQQRQRRRGEGPPQRRQQGQGQRAGRPSSGPQQPSPPAPRNVGYVGKHRLTAAINRLDQELQSLQDELDELETMEPASAACQEVITSTEGKPDPLLPITSGPENSSWDRWFQRVRSSRSNKWWASKGSDFS